MSLGLEYGYEDLENATISSGFTTETFETILSAGQCKWRTLNTAMTILLVFTFLLNATSSFVLFRVPLVTVRGKSNPVYFCIRFLNICDVLQAIFLAVMPAFATDDCGWLGGSISCSIMGFIVLFFLLVSPLITILMAFDRVVALYRPFKYRSNLGLKMLKVSLPSACVMVFLTTILPIFGIGEYHVVKGRRFCLLDTITHVPIQRTYVIVVHVVFLLALIFMLSCTVAFQFKLARMSFTKKHQEFKSKTRKKVSSRRTRNATLTTMGVCVIFTVCYLPYVIRVLVEAVRIEKSPYLITWFTFGLAFLQPLLNPIVYIGTNARYRKELISLIKNINVSEWDTSSESGTSHYAPRGTFSGFCRKIVSGGSRSSMRGSKRRNHGSRTSLNNHSASLLAPVYAIDGNGTGKRASWKRRSQPIASCSENGFKVEKSATLKTIVQPLNQDDAHHYQDPSSSSGVKSCDSIEKTILTPHSVTTSLTFRLSGAPSDTFHGYGRSFRRDSELSGRRYRKRSHTVSGGEKSKSEVEPDSNLHCASTPTLVASKDLLADPEVHVNALESDAEIMSIHLLDHSPKSLPTGNCQRSPVIALTLPHTLPKVKRFADEESEDDTDVFYSVPETPPALSSRSSGNSSSHGSRSALNRARGRSSYKKALEMTSDLSDTRKPWKRDSGVGDS